MDFRLFYRAVIDNDERKIAEYFTPAKKVLESYLYAVYSATFDEAEEAVQTALVNIYENLRNNNLEVNEQAFFSYTVSAVRNAWLSIKRKEKYIESNDLYPDIEMISPEDQIQRLVDQDKKAVLAHCLNKLSRDYRSFIGHWLKNPEIDTAKIAKRYKTTAGNIWTKKHRIIKLLNECVTKNLKK